MNYDLYRTGAVDGTEPTPTKIPGAVNGGERRSFTARFDLADSASNFASGQKCFCSTIPQGHALQAIRVRSTVSLTTSTLKFGTAASDALYGSAAAYGTTPDVEKEYLLTAQKGLILGADANILMTIGTANLPASGTVVVEIITSARG